MNTATQCIRTTCVLSIALLICGTTVATQISERAKAKLYPQGYDSLARDTYSCASGDPAAIAFDHGVRQGVPSCDDSTRRVTVSPSPVRLAKPLSDNHYIRSGDSIRYSF